jgi:hypothetical protein
MVVPLDPLFLVTTATLRWEDCRDDSFDWLHANVHDSGMLGKAEGTLFYRHRDLGGIGPYARYMNVPRTNADGDRKRVGELHYGLVFGTRPGWVAPRGGNADLFFLQLIFKFGDESFGLHPYRLPLYPLAVYRATLHVL